MVNDAWNANEEKHSFGWCCAKIEELKQQIVTLQSGAQIEAILALEADMQFQLDEWRMQPESV